MKYWIFLCLFFLNATQRAISQNPYYPDGKKVTFKFTSIRSVLDSIGVKETESHFYKDDMVYFKRLSNNPVVVFTKTPLRIKESIVSYTPKYQKYLFSYSYWWDMRNMIDSGTLTRNYLMDVFGKPDSEIEEEDGTITLIFKKYNAKVVLKDDLAIAADVINYKAIERNGLTITNYSVTGSDYTIGFDISILNTDKRTIKYMFISITAKNSVNDVVGTKTVKAIGPVKHLDTGTYEFEDVFYSKVAEYLNINAIKIQYMDGSFRTISKSEIYNIRLLDWKEIGERPLED